MKSKAFYQHEQNSAEQVVAHAAWRRSRSRRPSMSYMGVRNPRRALRLAEEVAKGAARGNLASLVGGIILKHRSFDKMSDNEIELAVRNIVVTSSSKDEVRQRLRDELNYPHDVNILTSFPVDPADQVAREIVRGLGGMVMRDGSMAMVRIQGHDRLILLS